MIITLTLNPALDKTAELDAIVLSGLNRLENLRVDAGGKGINVSKMLKTLGSDSLATGFLGGGSGEEILRQLDSMQIKHDFVRIAGSTRSNLKVLLKDAGITEFNEAGPEVSIEEQEALSDKLLSLASRDTLFVLSGSVPHNFPPTYYRDLCLQLKQRGARVFVDVDGDALKHVIAAKPDLVKPNLEELAAFFSISRLPDLKEAKELVRRLLDYGVKMLALSMGSQGALFLRDELCIYAEGLKVQSKSTVGAGDSMLAALAYGSEHSLPFTECVQLALAASAAAVTTEGTTVPEADLIWRLKENVVLHWL